MCWLRIGGNLDDLPADRARVPDLETLSPEWARKAGDGAASAPATSPRGRRVAVVLSPRAVRGAIKTLIWWKIGLGNFYGCYYCGAQRPSPRQDGFRSGFRSAVTVRTLVTGSRGCASDRLGFAHKTASDFPHYPKGEGRLEYCLGVHSRLRTTCASVNRFTGGIR